MGPFLHYPKSSEVQGLGFRASKNSPLLGGSLASVSLPRNLGLVDLEQG